LKFRREHIAELIPELKPLLELHYQELTLNKDVVKLAPKWDEYIALEDMGRFVILTARDDAGRLTAYNAFFTNTHMHYSALDMAVNDVFYIHDDFRRGSLALRFLRYTEATLKALVAPNAPLKLVYHFKRGNNFAAILAALDYVDEEGVAAKII
jgi:hypothetical protein